jgi:hypothetical protein
LNFRLLSQQVNLQTLIRHEPPSFSISLYIFIQFIFSMLFPEQMYMDDPNLGEEEDDLLDDPSIDRNRVCFFVSQFLLRRNRILIMC